MAERSELDVLVEMTNRRGYESNLDRVAYQQGYKDGQAGKVRKTTLTAYVNGYTDGKQHRRNV